MSIKLKQDSKSAWLFLAPSLLLYGLYVLFPIVFTVYLSFTSWDGISIFPRPLCLEDAAVSCFGNYAELFETDIFWTSLMNNGLWLIFFSLSPIFGLFLALFFHVKTTLASPLKSLLFAPMVFSLVVVGMIWSWFLQPGLGLFDALLHGLGVLGPNEEFDLMTRLGLAPNAGVIAAAIWPHSAYCMILYLAGLSNLQKNIIEAALIDGANRWQLLWHVILPMLRPASIIVVIVTMIGALRAFDIVAIMTKGGPANSTSTLALYMYQETFVNFRYGYGAAIAVVLFMVSLGLIIAYLRQVQKGEN
jgi:multiple sugar transport system permease protein